MNPVLPDTVHKYAREMADVLHVLCEAAGMQNSPVLPIGEHLQHRLLHWRDAGYVGVQEILFYLFDIEYEMPNAERASSPSYRAFAVTCLKRNFSFLPVELVGPRASAIIYCIRCCVFEEILNTGNMELYVKQYIHTDLTSL